MQIKLLVLDRKQNGRAQGRTTVTHNREGWKSYNDLNMKKKNKKESKTQINNKTTKTNTT